MLLRSKNQTRENKHGIPKTQFQKPTQNISHTVNANSSVLLSRWSSGLEIFQQEGPKHPWAKIPYRITRVSLTFFQN